MRSMSPAAEGEGITQGEPEIIIWADCECPQCGFRFPTQVPRAHAESPDAWRKGHRLCILCRNCVPPPKEYHWSPPAHKQDNRSAGAKTLTPKQKHTFFVSRGKIRRGYRGERH